MLVFKPTASSPSTRPRVLLIGEIVRIGPYQTTRTYFVRGKYHFTADLFDWFGFGQTSEYFVDLTYMCKAAKSNVS